MTPPMFCIDRYPIDNVPKSASGSVADTSLAPSVPASKVISPTELMLNNIFRQLPEEIVRLKDADKVIPDPVTAPPEEAGKVRVPPVKVGISPWIGWMVLVLWCPSPESEVVTLIAPTFKTKLGVELALNLKGMVNSSFINDKMLSNFRSVESEIWSRTLLCLD
jgi:hypothetical protein